jgi:hypothetical protein
MKNKIFILAWLLLLAVLLLYSSTIGGAAAHLRLDASPAFSLHLPFIQQAEATLAPGETRTPTVFSAPTKTYTPSPTQTPTLNGSETPTETFTETPTETFTETPTETLTETPTATYTSTPSSTPTSDGSFTFASIADSQYMYSNFTLTANQIKTLNPNFVIHTGDLTSDGIYANDSDGEMTAMTNVLSNAGLFTKTFIVRGNHDAHQTNSYLNWEAFLTSKLGSTRSLPDGVTNYVAMSSSSTYRTYSFDYGNSRFIGVDVTGLASMITTDQYSFMDARLTDAESLGLKHAFLFFHGPEYCVGSLHCECTTKTDASCTPSAFITLVNKHPIISATFHGHEHALAYVHMDSTRLSKLTHPYEEFLTSTAGAPLDFSVYTTRVTANYTSNSKMSFALIKVNGSQFTVYFYRVGTTTALWSKTFSK